MKKLLLLITVIFIMFTTSNFAQRELSIFDKPHELNTEFWLSRFPNSSSPITIDYTPTVFSSFTNINISNQSAPQNEPSVRISRKNPNRVVAAWRDFRTGVDPALRRVGYSFSTDGGQTWSVSQLTPQIIPDAPLSSDPVVGVDTSGNFYIYTVSINEITGNGELWLFKSTDEGETFDQAYEIASSPWYEDKEWGTTDLSPSSAFANTLYCGWTRYDSTIPTSFILLVKSTDNGVTWNSPVSVSDQSIGGGASGAFPAISSNGELYVVWSGSDYNYGAQIRFDRSTDGGLTFGADKIVSDTSNIHGGWPTMAVDLSGGPFHNNIYVVWSDNSTNGDFDVFLCISSNGGDTWTPAQRINNDPISNGRIQYFPTITISELGEIVIMFYDARNTPDNTIIEAYIARSTDGGVTFTNELVSTQSTPTNVPNYDVRFGDYIDIDFYGGNLISVWTDERAGGFDMDIYTATINPILTDVIEVNSVTVSTIQLEQNYPNPFNPSTVISFQLPVSSNVILKIYDVLGNEIATLVNEEKDAGSYEIEFDGSEMTSGIYFYQLRVGDPETSSGQGFVETKKMILLK